MQEAPPALWARSNVRWPKRPCQRISARRHTSVKVSLTFTLAERGEFGDLRETYAAITPYFSKTNPGFVLHGLKQPGFAEAARVTGLMRLLLRMHAASR